MSLTSDQLNLNLTLVFSAHGSFNRYLYRFGKAEDTACLYFALGQDDEPWHTLSHYEVWKCEREGIPVSMEIAEGEFNLRSLVLIMSRNDKGWKYVFAFVCIAKRRTNTECIAMPHSSIIE